MTVSDRIYVDLMSTDRLRRVVLTSLGTLRDIERLGIVLSEGMELMLYTDDADHEGRQDNIIFEGVAHYDHEANRWVAAIDWNELRHESDLSE